MHKDEKASALLLCDAPPISNYEAGQGKAQSLRVVLLNMSRSFAFNVDNEMHDSAVFSWSIQSWKKLLDHPCCLQFLVNFNAWLN